MGTTIVLGGLSAIVATCISAGLMLIAAGGFRLR